MATLDSLIANAESRAGSYAAETGFLTQELRQFIADLDIDVHLPPDVNLANYTIPAYVSPTQTPTPDPTYEEPTVSLPTTPTLVGVGSITLPADRAEPEVNTTGLFQHVMPSSNIPSIDETSPDMHVDDLVAELDALVTPVIRDYEFPEVHDFSLTAPTTVTMPVYDAPAMPDEVRDPTDYAAEFSAAYAQMAPEMQAFIDDKVTAWINTYAPELSSWTTLLKSKVEGGMDGGVLPDQFEAAMYARAQGRTEREFQVAMLDIIENSRKSGFMELPGAVASNLVQARLRGAAALADQATDIYVERRKSEVQHTQFVMTLTSNQITSVRNTAISYAQTVGETIGRATTYANNIADALSKVFDHLIARANLRLQILTAVDAQYASKLKAALSEYEAARIELEIEKGRTDVDLAKIRQIEAQINSQGLNIQKYTAIVDAVAKKGALEELKTKEYGIRSEIFGNKIKAHLAGFDAYRAAMAGDRDKLDGELSKIKVFESLVNMDITKVDAQAKQIAAQQSVNAGNVDLFRAGADIYKVGVGAALDKFTAQAEVRKLAGALYGQELTNAIEKYRVGLELPKLMINAILQQYELRMRAAIESAKIEIDKLQISEHASATATQAWQAMAAAALGSLNTVASQSIEATA